MKRLLVMLSSKHLLFLAENKLLSIDGTEKSRVRFLSLSSAPRAMRSRRSALPPVNSTQRA
jgi:hypothetical protein